MMPTDQPSGSSQMVRIGLPFTFMASQVSDFEVLSMLYPAVGVRLQAAGACRNVAHCIGWETPVAAIDYEVEYDNRARVPEHPEIFARWMREAEDDRAETLKAGRAQLELPYGVTMRQSIDLFLPENGEAAPLALFIHGGWWR